ncbi:LacI family DNA-binding transcriptional regulator [Haematomicrobium sanguinis]|uniref:LacI family DNA-binding transcriptional regulator n=1 Tax=Haematomicrobium sanguinis TaxID=479106 RepID=UPI00047E7E28|nr:LacI family DNA-binding transcriptional regulator [Haematomicrobium sanguinis]
MAKAPTVYDVAAKAGVSIATVSFAFRQPHRVKDSTRETVLSAARELGYLPSGSARGLARGRTGVLGVFSFDYYADDEAGSAAGPLTAAADRNRDYRYYPVYGDEVQRGMALQCRARGYALLTGSATEMSGNAQRIQDLAGQVDGLAIFPNVVSDEQLRLIAQRIPVVELSSPGEVRAGGQAHVSVDNESGMRALLDHLIRVHGFRRFTFLDAQTSSPDFRGRSHFFAEALAESGIDAEVASHIVSDDASPWAAAEVDRLLADPAGLPDVLVCVHDEIALPMMDELERRGISVPGDVAVTGFDGIVAGRLSRPPLTTVRQPMEAIGRSAVDMLIRAAEGSGEAQTQVLPVELMVRESCGCSG